MSAKQTRLVVKIPKMHCEIIIARYLTTSPPTSIAQEAQRLSVFDAVSISVNAIN